MIVYGSSLSPFVRKVLAFAAEKGVAVELQAMPRDPGPDFAVASPFRKMPGFRDGDFAISDSSAIVAYLEAKHPTPALIPDEAKARARTVWFDEFADTILFPPARDMFFNRIVAPRFMKRAGDAEAADRAEREGMPPVLDYLETQIPAHLHLVGERLTLADIAVASLFVNLDHLGFPMDPERHPRILAFKTAMLSRPSFAAIVEGEKRLLAA